MVPTALPARAEGETSSRSDLTSDERVTKRLAEALDDVVATVK